MTHRVPAQLVIPNAFNEIILRCGAALLKTWRGNVSLRSYHSLCYVTLKQPGSFSLPSPCAPRSVSDLAPETNPPQPRAFTIPLPGRALMKRKALTLLAAVTVLFALSAATASPAKAQGPLFWLVHCSTHMGNRDIEGADGKAIHDAVASCLAMDGQVSGVEPVFGMQPLAHRSTCGMSAFMTASACR